MLLRSLKAVAVRPCACALSASCFQPTLRLLSSASGSSTPPPYPGAAGDHYQTLGLPPSASLDDIKRAFREQALLYHPDVTHASGDAQEASLAKFKQLNEAYSVLGDAEQRRQYDREHRPKGQRRAGSSLQERNEGVFGGVPPVDASVVGDAEAEKEAFRAAMARAAERQKEGQRSRATIARQTRQKLPDEAAGGGLSWSTIFPVAVVGLWVVNFTVFGK